MVRLERQAVSNEVFSHDVLVAGTSARAAFWVEASSLAISLEILAHFKAISLMRVRSWSLFLRIEIAEAGETFMFVLLNID
jgi:hypothetical protein